MTFGETNSAVDEERAAIVKAMLARGDRAQDIATWFGVPLHVVQMIQFRVTHSLVPAAPAFALPPPGPYPHLQPAYEILEKIRAAEHELRVVSARLRHSATRQAMTAPR